MSEYESSDLLDMTAEIVSSYVSNNQVEADALPQLITNIYETVSGLPDLSRGWPEAQDAEAISSIQI